MTSLFQTDKLSFGGFIYYGNLLFPAGKITFLTGESGAGKSTLFKLFNGVLSPSEGAVYYNGKNVEKLDAVLLRREVSLVSQEVYLFNGSIRDNFYAFYEYRHLQPPDDTQIKALLSMFCLDFTPESPTHTLSGGEKQRLYLSVFMSFCPKVLLLDEPTSALDNQTGEKVLENMIHFCREKSMELLIISHNRILAEKYSENTVLLGKQAAV